jgi:hypothetical protein
MDQVEVLSDLAWVGYLLEVVNLRVQMGVAGGLQSCLHDVTEVFPLKKQFLDERRKRSCNPENSCLRMNCSK